MNSDEFASLTCIPNLHIVKFIHHVIDNMSGGIQVSHNDYSECPLDKFWAAVQKGRLLATNITLGKISQEKVIICLQPLGKELAEEVYDAVYARRADIKKSLVSNSLKDVLHLQDFDWNVRLAVSSDKVLDLNEALVTLHLHTSLGSMESDIENISVEMSAAEVDKLLEELKAAQQRLTLLQDN